MRRRRRVAPFIVIGTLFASHAFAQAPQPVYLPLIASNQQPTAIPTAVPTARPTAGPTAIPTAAPTAAPTAIPPLPPPSYNNCQADPNAAAAPNYPVDIVAIDKGAETVTLRNVSPETIDLTNWTMCSILANQLHPVSGTLAPGETRVFPGPAGNIWNNSQRDDGALYNPNGQLVSYFVDPN